MLNPKAWLLPEKPSVLVLTPEKNPHLSGAPTLLGCAKKRRFLIGALQKDFGSRPLSGSHEPWHSRFAAHAGPPSAEADCERAPRMKAKQKFKGLQ
jgi:hypothetical protein